MHMRITVILPLLLLLTLAAGAATCTWTGNGDVNNGGNWHDGQNWSDGTIPGEGDTAIFPPVTTGKRTITIDHSTEVGTIDIRQAALPANVPLDAGTSVLRLASDLTVGKFILKAPEGDTRQRIMLDINGHMLTLAPGATTPWLIGNGSIVKTGGQSARLINKSFSGTIDIKEGTLDQKNTDLSSVRALTVHDGATLTGFAGDPLPKQTILNGVGSGGKGAYRCENRPWGTVWQPVMLASNTAINAESGDLRMLLVGGKGDLTKTGGGRLVLFGANTYTGTTTIEEGTVQLNGSVTGDLILAAGTAVSGVGRVSKRLLTADSCRLRPGSDYAPGTLIAGSVELANVTYAWVIADAEGEAGLQWSVLDAGASLAFSDEPFSIEITTPDPALPIANFDPTRAYTWTIASAKTITGFRPESVSIGTAELKNNLQGGTFSVVARDGELQLNFKPAPTPNTLPEGEN